MKRKVDYIVRCIDLEDQVRDLEAALATSQALFMERDKEAAKVEAMTLAFAELTAGMVEALQVTVGNIRSLGPAGALDAVPMPYRNWLRVVEEAIPGNRFVAPWCGRCGFNLDSGLCSCEGHQQECGTDKQFSGSGGK